jgi:hypothetical protein
MALGFLFGIFFAANEVVLTIFVMSWLNSFYHPDIGPIKDKDEVLKIF